MKHALKLNYVEKSTLGDLENDWSEKDLSEQTHWQVLYYYYTYENYSGDAFGLLFNRIDGKLYEINGGRCSCYGLEGQFSPEETSVAALKLRSDDCQHGKYGTDFQTVLDDLQKKKFK